MDTNAQRKENENVRKRILDIQEFRVAECPPDSPWIRPARIHYQQDGEQKVWDVTRAHDSVSIIVYNTSSKKLVFVRQFRPSFYYTFLPEKRGTVDLEKYPLTLGFTLELCAGIVDKDKPLVEIARDELREECGFEAPPEAFKAITTFRSVSTSVYKHTLFYVEVTDEMRIYPGGGAASEGELIEVVELSVPEVREYMYSEEVQGPPSLVCGISWFLANKPEHCS